MENKKHRAFRPPPLCHHVDGFVGEQEISPTRFRLDHFTTLETPTPKVPATERQLSPELTAETTRSRRSREEGRAIDAGLHSSINLESHPRQKGKPLSIQYRAEKL